MDETTNLHTLAGNLAASFPVAVIMHYQINSNSTWESGHWTVSAVLSGDEFADPDSPRCRPLHAGASNQLLCSGFEITLHIDETESYYQNLTGEAPGVFVVCNRDDAENLQPFLVTLSYDEAASYMEGEEEVHTVPLPAELYRWLEQYILVHYVPLQRKKRKRDNWKEQKR